MAIIEVKDLKKVFKIYKKQNGFIGSLKDLFKREYEYKTAVNKISFEVEKGEILGYIGPNGAGKSTTIKMLSGILAPTEGSIKVDGINPFKERIKNSKKIGVVFGQRTQLWWDIPVSESIELMRYMYNVPNNIYKSNLELFNDILGLNEFINTPVRLLSLGQRMRADLCCAFLHNPEIIYLDEPTIGLDVAVKKKVRDFIKEVNKIRKVTVILTTHDVSDIEKLCTRVLVIDKGELIFNGNLSDLKKRYGRSGRVIFDIKAQNMDMEKLKQDLKNRIMNISLTGSKLIIDYNKALINFTTIVKTVLNYFNVEDILYKEDDIEDIVREFYENGN